MNIIDSVWSSVIGVQIYFDSEDLEKFIEGVRSIMFK